MVTLDRTQLPRSSLTDALDEAVIRAERAEKERDALRAEIFLLRSNLDDIRRELESLAKRLLYGSAAKDST